MAEQNYTNIEDPYNGFLERQSSSSALPINSDPQDTTTPTDNSNSSGTPVSDPSSVDPSSLQGQAFTNLFIEGWIRSRNWQPKTRGFYIDGGTGYAEFANIYVTGTITAATLMYGKTSFTDSVNAGYFISSSGLYVGAATDATKLKYTVADGSFDFVGTISSRSTATVAAVIDANSQVITSRLNTSTKTILDGFKFTASGALNVSGTQTDVTTAASVGDTTLNVTSTTNFPSAGVFYLQGNTNWMRITYTGKTGTTLTGIPASSTGSITEASAIGKEVIGGPGILLSPKGIVGLNTSGVETFTIDGSTGSATFAGTLSAASGTLGTITSGSIYSGIFSTAAAAATTQRIVITNADNSLTLYDPSNNKVLDFGIGYAAHGVLMHLTPSDVSIKALQIGNVGGLVQTDDLILVSVDNSSSTGKSIFAGNVGSGTTLDISQAGTGKVILLSKSGTAATAVDITQATNAVGILITKSGTGGGAGLSISNGGTGSSIIINDTLATGGNSIDITNVGLQYGLSIVKNNTDGTNALHCIALTQAANVSTNFKKMINIGGTTFWLANATTPNGVLSGSTGDFCINCGSGKIAYCTGTTNWTLL